MCTRIEGVMPQKKVPFNNSNENPACCIKEQTVAVTPAIALLTVPK